MLQLSGAVVGGGVFATGNASASRLGDGVDDGFDLGLGTDATQLTSEPESQSESQSESEPPALGGGQGYDNVVHWYDADVVVETRGELERALAAATSGDVVYVAGNASIDLGSSTYTVPNGVTLASNRGIDDADGGHIYTDAETVLVDVRRNARVTGLQIQGPYYEYFDPDWYATGTGLRTVAAGVEVDNCEIWGFAHASVHAQRDAHVHHNEIHHNARDGLGYGVVTSDGHPLIEWNAFDYNRHSIASTGDHHGYTVRYNHFFTDAAGVVVDMHRPGGVEAEVHNNIVQPVELIPSGTSPLQGVQVRGVPNETYAIHDNWFYNPRPPRDSPAGSWTDEAIIQPTETAWQNVEWWNNSYGGDADVEPSDVIPGYQG